MNSESTTSSTLGWTALAAVIALCGVAGSLWLSVGMNLKACPLCLYQRTFLMSATAVLLLGLTSEMRRSAILPLVALPSVLAGLGVAGFHEYLEQTGKLECPGGVLGWGTAPQQSLIMLLVLSAVLLLPLLFGRAVKPWRTLGAAVLGAAMAVGAIASAPPMPPAPTTPYAQAPDVCRPPYRQAAPDQAQP